MNKISLDYILKKLDVDRKEFAELIGVSIHTVNSWGTGKRNIPKSTVMLAQKLIQDANHNHEGAEEKKIVFNPLTDSEKLEYIYKTIQIINEKIEQLEIHFIEKSSDEEREILKESLTRQ